MKHPIQQTGYSAEVRLELRADNTVFDLASIGPNQITLRQARDLPKCDAEVIMVVDGDVFLWPVRLPHGAVPYDKKVVTAPRGAMQRLGNLYAG